MTDEEVEALREELYQSLITSMKTVYDELCDRSQEATGSLFTALTVLHSFAAQEVGRLERIIEEAVKRAGLPPLDLIKERRTRIARGRSLVDLDEAT